MKTQHLSLWHSALRRFASVLLLLLFFATFPHSVVKAQTTPQHEFSISLSDNSAVEGNSDNSIAATVTVTTSKALTFPATVTLCFTGTATEGTDYTLIAPSTMDRITFRPDQAFGCNGGDFFINFNSSISSDQFRIQVSGDGDIENDEAIIISLTRVDTRGPNSSKVGISPTAGSVTFTIENDDFPTANFAAASSNADEDDGTVNVAVNLSKNAIMNTNVAYSVSGTAASAMDFAALSGTVQITSGIKTANISIPIIDDNTDEPNETIVLTLNDSFGYEVGSPKVHTLTINDDDATPRITSLATASVAENTTAVLTVTATDTDDDDDDLTYSITAGADSVRFSIDPSDGDLTFKTAPDFEAPGSADNSNAYEVIVTVSDGTNNITQTITVTVTDENDNSPMIKSLNTARVAENTTTVLTVMAEDADTGTTLTYSITAGADSARFRINQNLGDLTFKTAPDFEGASTDGDDDYEVIVTVSDGTNTDMQTITVTLTDVNEPPVIVAQIFSIAENTAVGTTVGTVAATDPEDDPMTFSFTSGNLSDAFAINENTGVITVAGTIDHETTLTYTLTVQVSDGDLSANAAVTINVTNENDNSPVITSPATASVAENTTTVLTVTATDADAGTTLTYSIGGGADRALFRINRTSGALTFITAPDFENPSDQGRNNEYIVEVTASDGSNSIAQTITVTVTDDSADNILSFSADEEAAVIFPNPSGRYLEVRSAVGDTFQLLSLSGKPVLQGTTNTKVDIESLQSGLYFVQLPDGRLLKFVRE